MIQEQAPRIVLDARWKSDRNMPVAATSHLYASSHSRLGMGSAPAHTVVTR